MNRHARTWFAVVAAVTLSAPGVLIAAEQIAVLVAVRGKVEVVPARAKEAQRAALGRVLDRGDKVQVDAGGSATLFFSDGNVIDVGERSSIVIGGRLARTKVGPGASLGGDIYDRVSTFATGGSRGQGLVAVAPLRGGESSSTIIVRPRRTELMSVRPTFEWRAIDGATRYRVTVSGDQGELWTREIAGVTLDYPSNVPPLVTEADYVWEVHALSDRGPLRKEDSMFHVLSTERTAAIQQDLDQIGQKAGGADAEAARYLAGSYLFGHGLYQDAADAFEALCRLDPEAAGPHEALGNVYRAIGLTDEAAVEYQKALTLGRDR